MTCIVGYKEDGKVYVGADSQATSGSYAKHMMQDKKVFRNGEFVIGYTTSFRMGQVLQFDFEPPIYEGDEDLMKFMVSRFIPEVRDLFKDAGFAKTNSDRESGGAFIVGIRDRLFEIEDDYQVQESLFGYNATGSGYAFAIGAMTALEPYELSPKNRVKTAIKIASKHCPSVGGKISVLST